MTTIGQRLVEPEFGWKRYDEDHSAFIYSNHTWGWSGSAATAYNGDAKVTNQVGANVKFDFIGTKLRIIDRSTGNQTDSVTITIDGVSETVSFRGANDNQILVYEKLGLPNQRHNVTVTTNSGGTSNWFEWDAVDIDEDGILLNPSEATPFTKILIEDNGLIKTYNNSNWIELGNAPATVEMFSENGMNSIDSIPQSAWNEISSNSKILIHSNQKNEFTVNILTDNLYDSVGDLYHGTGIIETETEELPITRKFLMINAEHENCTFKYSLNNGGTWTDIMPGELKDITKENGIQLKIQVNLPSDDATLTAISYAWA